MSVVEIKVVKELLVLYSHQKYIKYINSQLILGVIDLNIVHYVYISLSTNLPQKNFQPSLQTAFPLGSKIVWHSRVSNTKPQVCVHTSKCIHYKSGTLILLVRAKVLRMKKVTTVSLSVNPLWLTPSLLK